VTGVPAALGFTLLFGLLAWYPLRQVRTGEWSSWHRSSSIRPALVRVSGVFGLAFCAVGTFAVWWSVLGQP